MRGRQHLRRVVLRVFANRDVRAASSGYKAQIVWQARDIVTVSFYVAGAVFGADPLCVECDFAWQSQYFWKALLQFTLDTPHSALYTLHSPL